MKRNRPKKLEGARAAPDHAWTTMRGTPVCEACGVVRRADGRNKACAGRLPRIVLRVDVPMVVVVGTGIAARRVCDECWQRDPVGEFSVFHGLCTLPCETCGAHPRPCFCDTCRPATPRREWRPAW